MCLFLCKAALRLSSTDMLTHYSKIKLLYSIRAAVLNIHGRCVYLNKYIHFCPPVDLLFSKFSLSPGISLKIRLYCGRCLY